MPAKPTKIPIKVRMAQLLNLLSTENVDKIHYIEIATKLNVSPSVANQLARTVAITHSKTWSYESGWLLRNDMYSQSIEEGSKNEQRE